LRLWTGARVPKREEQCEIVFWHHLSSALGDAAIAHIRVLFAYTFYDFLLVFSDDLTSCWIRCRVTSRGSRQVVIPRPKKEQENEQRHEESDKPLSLDATQKNSRHRGDNSGRLSQQRPTPTIIIISSIIIIIR